MSHNIKHFTYAEKENKNRIQKDLDTYVSHETWQEGGHGTGGIRWLDAVCKSREEAEQYIEKHDRGWYDCLAVRYEAPIQFTSKKLEELKQAVITSYKVYEDRANMNYPSTLTSEFIGCKSCGSRLNRAKMAAKPDGNKCPVCREDLRTDTILKSIETAKNKWKRVTAQKEEYINSHAKKERRWLVKIEYHT